MTFNNTQEIPTDVSSFFLIRFEEVWRALHNNVMEDNTTGTARYGWLALNSDGAAKGAPGPASVGGFVVLQVAYSLNFGSCTSFKAEIKAVEYGLELATRMGVAKLQVQMDNKAAVSALNGIDDYGGKCVHMIHNCRRLISDPRWTVEVKHCYREANRAADWLPNQGVSQNNKIVLTQVSPLNLGRILHDDVVRFIPP